MLHDRTGSLSSEITDYIVIIVYGMPSTQAFHLKQERLEIIMCEQTREAVTLELNLKCA